MLIMASAVSLGLALCLISKLLRLWCLYIKARGICFPVNVKERDRRGLPIRIRSRKLGSLWSAGLNPERCCSPVSESMMVRMLSSSFR